MKLIFFFQFTFKSKRRKFLLIHEKSNKYVFKQMLAILLFLNQIILPPLRYLYIYISIKYLSKKIYL